MRFLLYELPRIRDLLAADFEGAAGDVTAHQPRDSAALSREVVGTNPRAAAKADRCDV